MRQKFSRTLVALVVLILCFSFNIWIKPAKSPRILVFSKTSGYRHTSIPAGKLALMKLGAENGFLVDTTENADYFVDDSLKNYSAVIFLSTTQNVLNSAQETSFKRYIQAGGGFVGIHAASDTEYDWSWYGKLVGGYFISHPKQQEAVVQLVDKNNISTSHLPDRWKRFDEWYNFKDLNPAVKVLLKLDEKTYDGGKNGDNHPIAWYHECDGGRAFYTGLGHTEESYSEPLFLKHVLGGIRYAIGNNVVLNYSKTSTPPVPESNRFVKNVLTQGTLEEPTELTILPNLDILVAQRRGGILHFDNKTRKLSQAGNLSVYHKASVPGVNAEEGVLGIAADPKFSTNNHVFIFYSPADTSVNRLSRFTFRNNKIDMASEKVVLQFYSQRQICCHTGGSIAFGPDGLLYVSTGDNSTPFDVPKNAIANHGFAPLDNRPGLEQYDARRSSGNSNDLRGKILRIRVRADGSYEIPQGNLFGANTEKARPEIYVMGNRNPYRISVDPKNSYLYWGEVGPDSRVDSASRGPRGYDEVNQARQAGFFGWPLFVGNNKPYKAYDYKTGISGTSFEVKKPVNNSPNNTGLEVLPAAQPAFIWYPYAASKEFPDVGEGGRTAMAGPVYYSDLYPKATRYPDYYNGKLIIYEWVRDWVKAVSLKANGDYDSMEPFASDVPLAAPIDMEVGPDGRFYVLEYGKGWFSKNPDAGISRIDYLAGNRPPQISALVIPKTSGLLPYKLTAKVEVSDPDKDKLTYRWSLGKGITRVTTEPTLQYTFAKAGTYPVIVTVTDGSNATSKSQVINVTAGNEQPKVNIQVKGNKTFYFPGKPVNYQVIVSDNGATVNKSRIYVSSSYTEGTDLAAVTPPVGHQVSAEVLPGRAIMLKGDCKACHQVSAKSIGPAFTQISTRYQTKPQAVSYLSNKIIKGSAGVWGEVPMPAHPTMNAGDVRKISEWIMSLSAKSSVKPSLPLSGSIVPEPAKQNTEKKTFNLAASYTDQGSASGAKPLSGNYTLTLMHNVIDAEYIKNRKGFGVKDSSGTTYITIPSSKGTLRLNGLDLTDVSKINFNALTRGGTTNFTVQIRLDSDNGEMIGSGVLSSDNIRRDISTGIPISPVRDGKNHDLIITFVPQEGNSRLRPYIRSVEFVAQ